MAGLWTSGVWGQQSPPAWPLVVFLMSACLFLSNSSESGDFFFFFKWNCNKNTDQLAESWVSLLADRAASCVLVSASLHLGPARVTRVCNAWLCRWGEGGPLSLRVRQLVTGTRAAVDLPPCLCRQDHFSGLCRPL